MIFHRQPIQHFTSALLLVLLLTSLFLAAHPVASAMLAGVTERVSVSSTGEQGNGASGGYALSPDGRFVAFSSYASNLVSGDTNGHEDIFVHDRQTGLTERVSVSSTGEQANGSSFQTSISADGRFVAFYSEASNLVSGDTNRDLGWDVFVHDRQTGETERVSVSSTGEQGNRRSFQTSISADGRFVAFMSEASNLVGGDTNGEFGWDIFVHDRQTDMIERVSVSSTGEQGNHLSHNPSISADGRFVAFESEAFNLVGGDTNNTSDIFVHDRQTGKTERVSVSSKGEQGNRSSFQTSISADGRFVAFSSRATNLVSGDTDLKDNVFVHDRQTGETERVPGLFTVDPISWWSFSPSISADGRFVAFMSYASNLAAGDADPQLDIFVHDRQSGLTELASVSTDEKGGNGYSYNPALSADGCFVAFSSDSSNLVHGDTSWAADIFVRDRQTGVTQRVSVSSTGDPGDFHSHFPALSAEGRFVAFSSDASNLVEGDTNFFCGDFENNCGDVFVYDRCPGGDCPKAHSYLPVINR